MTAFNVVRFKVKPGHEKEFIDAHKMADPGFSGMRRFSMVNTGPGTFCVIGEWNSFDDIVAAREGMIGMLDSLRHMLDDFGGGLGVTDPVSGSAVLDFGPAQKKAKARKKPAKKAAKNSGKKTVKKAAKKKSSKRGWK